jgi:ectoine hydroxylase-related dioxygenase (phytanoyl-CoA dioxygenase family)
MSLSTPMLSSYGVRQRLPCSDATDIHVQEIQLLGFTVVEGVVAEGELPHWRDRIDGLIAAQNAIWGSPEESAALGEANTARAAMAQDRDFMDLVMLPEIHEVCRRLLGPYFVLSQQNVVVNPGRQEGHHQKQWHRDLPYQHYTSSSPLSISALVAIDEFSTETGGTVVLPASHKLVEFPCDEVVLRQERTVNAPPGSCLVFDSMLYHRAGSNVGPRVRRAVNHVFTVSVLRQQIDLPRALGPGFPRNQDEARILGFQNAIPGSIQEWAEQRRERAPAAVASRR